MNIEYSKQGDYYIPNIVAQKNTKDFILGKYGRMRLRYLKEHKKAEYTILLMNNKLQSHLIETDRDIQASELSKAIQQYEGDVEIIKK